MTIGKTIMALEIHYYLHKSDPHIKKCLLCNTYDKIECLLNEAEEDARVITYNLEELK